MANAIDTCRSINCTPGEPITLFATGVGTNDDRAPTIEWELVAFPLGAGGSILSPSGDGRVATFVPTFPGCYTIKVTCCYDVNPLTK